MLDEIDYEAVAQDLKGFGYALVRTAGGEEALMSAARGLGRCVGAGGFGFVHLDAVGSDEWLGRHTESLTDGPTPLRYFALGCLFPAARGGATHLYDGSEAARLLVGLYPESRQVRIRYRSAHRAESSEHPLIAEHEQHGAVLRFRSACEHNTVTAGPVGLSDVELYKAVEGAVGAALVHVQMWRAGEVLIVDNHRMLHSRAPFAGRRHMLRVRYDDPLHQTVRLAG
jgi:Taurine catabolism dioxygenase TauD, TfdA family